MASSPLKRLSRLLFARPDQSDPAKRAFIHEALLARDMDMAVGGSLICLVFHVLSSLVEPFIVEREFALRIIWQSRAVVFVWAAVYFLFLRRFVRFPYATLPWQLFTIVPFWLIFRLDAMDGSTTILKSWTAFLGVISFSIVLVPFHRWVPPVQFLFYSAATVAVWAQYPVGRSMIPISLLAIGAAFMIQRVIIRKALWDAAREYDSRQLLSKMERAAIETELQLARDIQDSLTPPTHLTMNGISAHFFQAKHAQVGGDWMGLREVDGKIIAVIADATGKGLQAALVIHAVQSLWAETLDWQAFDPQAWMHRVNQALLRLGERKPHTVSMGIAVFEANHLTWYSAGHLPVFVSRKGDSGPEIEALTGRGQLLGMFPLLHVDPVRTELPADSFFVVAGSDGVFEKGTAHSKREISDIIGALRKNPERALAERPAVDDKSVLIVEKAA